MGLQYEKYKFARTRLDDVEFNKRWRSIDLRLHSLEEGQASIDAAVDSLVAKGLADLSNQIAASVTLLNDSVEDAQVILADAESRLDILETQFTNIIEGGSLPAASTSLVPSGNLAASNVQDALYELQGDIDTLNSEFSGLSGTTKVVANNTARDALTNLAVGDQVHVIDSDGSGNFQRWQITAITDGAWSTSTKESIQVENSVAAHTHPMSEVVGLVTALSSKSETGHVHAIANITGLQTALDAKVPTTRAVGASGLATGGGALSSDISIAVAAASAAELRTGTETGKALTPGGAMEAADPVTLTDASTITFNMSAGINFKVTLGGNRTMGSPSGVVAGKSGVIRIAQDGAGNRTLDWSSNWKWVGGTKPTLSTAANAVDGVSYYAFSSTEIWGFFAKDIK